MSALKWHKVAESVNEMSFGNNGIATVEAGGKTICIASFDGGWYGFAFKCPHASGIMANGNLDASGNVVCPLHRYKFSIKNGRNTSGEGYFLKTYPVEWRDDGLFVGLSTGIFG